MKAPTKRQEEILSFISSYTAQNGYSPSQREIGEYLSISLPGVHYALDGMKKKGLLEKKEGGARSLSLSQESREERTNVAIPFFPSEPDRAQLEGDSRDTLLIPLSLFSPSSFAFTVSSWSMVGGGIIPGDIAILDKERNAKDGDIVLAQPEGSEGKMELRRLRRLHSFLELWPENDSMGITRSQAMTVYGILREIRRRY